jgi:dCTP diphosphatase
MYLFKTSGATFDSVIANAKHAFRGKPQEWSVGEWVLVSKNKEDCRPGEKQIQYVMRLHDIRPLRPQEAEHYWPGNEGRWRWMVDCRDTRQLARPFNLKEALKELVGDFAGVMTYKRLGATHEELVREFLDRTNPGALDRGPPTSTATDLHDRLRQFVAEREWGKFHSPKNLAAGLTVEAAELLEIFQWLTEDESRQLGARQLARLREEIGDVQLYLLNLADQFGLDPMACAAEKLEANRAKYPAERVRGSARKYDEY